MNRKLMCRVGLALAVMAGSTVMAAPRAQDNGDNVVKKDAKAVGHGVADGARDVGHATKDVAVKVGHGFKGAGIGIGHGAKKAGVGIGHGAKEGWDATKSSFKNAFGKGDKKD
jgi:hypothetical protein